MILKIQKGGQFLGIIKYHEEKVDEGEAELLQNNTFATSVNGKTKAFLDVVDLNEKVKKNKVVHLCISLPHTDKLSDQEFLTMVDEYRNHLGYRETPSLVYRHYDKEHAHVHVVLPSVDYQGKKISDYNDHRKGEELSRQLELKYGLSITLNKSGGSKNLAEINQEKFSISNALRNADKSLKHNESIKKLTGLKPREILQEGPQDNFSIKARLNQSYYPLSEYLKKEGLLKPSQKEKLIGDLFEIYRHSNTPEDYHNRIKEAGLYSRILFKDGQNSIYYGDPTNGMYLKEKQVPSQLRYENIHKAGANYQSYHSQRSTLQRLIRRCIRSSSSPEQLEQNLKQNAIKVEYAKNAGGIYGVSFSSSQHENPVLFKGSQLGKEFSWNTIKAVLSTNSKKPAFPKKNTIKYAASPLNLKAIAHHLDEDERAIQKRKRRVGDDEENEHSKGI